MPNRLLFSIRYFSKVFYKFLKVSFSLVVFLTLIRFNLFFLSVSAWLKDSSFSEVFMAFFTGLRFDILVMGFLIMPILLFWYLITFFVQWGRFATVVSKAWFKIVWAAIILLQIVDFMHFHVHGARIREAQFAGLLNGELADMWALVPVGPFFVFVLVVIIIWGLGLWVMDQVELGDWKDEYSPIRGNPTEITWRLLVPLLIVVAMARGTLEEHHLRYEHSLTSNDTRLNEMALNPMWSLDK